VIVKDKSLLLSVLGHVVILTLLTLDLSFTSKDPFLVASIPIFIDLSEVEIGDMTNLPDTGRVVSAEQPILPQAGRQAPSDAQVQIDQATPREALSNLLDNLIAQRPEPPRPTPAPPQPPRPEPPAPQPRVYRLDSLLASLDKEPPAPQGGAGAAGVGIGDREMRLSVSERDAIAIKLRSCWNIDPGVAGVKNMVAVINVQLNRDGTVKTVAIQDTSRLRNDPAFRAVAESARRAVHICDQLGDNSPFRILARLYGGDYLRWRDLILNFNPYDGGVI